MGFRLEPALLVPIDDQNGSAAVGGTRSKAYRRAFETVRRNAHVTPDMETGLTQIQSFLMIPDGEILNERSELAHLRLLADIQDGKPPIRTNVGIILQRNETAYWAKAACLLEQCVVGRGALGESGFVLLKGFPIVLDVIGGERLQTKLLWK